MPGWEWILCFPVNYNLMYSTTLKRLCQLFFPVSHRSLHQFRTDFTVVFSFWLYLHVGLFLLQQTIFKYLKEPCKADIRNPSLQLCWQGLASLLAHERSRFAICQWELSTPTDISIPLTRRLVLRALEAGECLSAFKCRQLKKPYQTIVSWFGKASL